MEKELRVGGKERPLTFVGQASHWGIPTTRPSGGVTRCCTLNEAAYANETEEQGPEYTYRAPKALGLRRFG